MDLHGYNAPTAYTQDEVVKERIWSGIITLVEAGSLVTVRAVRHELKNNAPDCHRRFRNVWGKFVKRDTPPLLIEAGQILDSYPSLVRSLDRRTNDREPADPYIIAYALLNAGVRVVTNELPKSRRSPNNRSGYRIPDVCDDLNLGWMSLADLVRAENL